jgi:CheY-like chemotaxis protein
VDDDHLLRETLQDQLELSGYTVLPAANGAEAVFAFEADGADLLLTDFSMPGIDGLTLIARLQGRGPNLPTILITGYAGDVARTGQKGSYRLLNKPFTVAKLQAELVACLGARARG